MTAETTHIVEQSRLGIVAGGGGLPIALVNSCVTHDRPFMILALEGFTDSELVEGHPHQWVRLGEVGKAFDILHKEKVTELVMAGHMRRPSLKELRPDMRGLKFFAKIGTAALGDDGLLRAVAAEMEEEGFKLVGAHEVCQDLLIQKGPAGKRKPGKKNWNDIEHGWHISGELGRMDVGQSAVVQEGLVLGLEAIEGTDELIKRCAELKRDGVGPVLIKRCKPDQEKRADLPTIGLRTVQNAIDSGLSGIAVEAERTLFLERDEAIEAANKAGLFILGVTAEDILS